MKAAVFSILILCMPFALMAETLDDVDVLENPTEVALFNEAALHNQAEKCEDQSVDGAMEKPTPVAFTPGPCSARAYCWDGSTVSCSTLSAPSCGGVNHDCSVASDGWVHCGSVLKFCSGCPGGGSGECSQGASCISSIDCGADGQCAGGTCHCD